LIQVIDRPILPLKKEKFREVEGRFWEESWQGWFSGFGFDPL
jgi:hypothetical protein